MARALSLFYPLVTPYVLGAPNPMIDQALLYSAGELCRESHIVQEIATQNVVAGQQDYDVDVPNGFQLSAVITVWHGDAELNPAGPSEVHPGTAARGAVGDIAVPTGSPSTFYQKIPTDPVISLWPVPDTAMAGGLAVRAAFEPSASATTLADVLFDTYAYEVMYGAVAYLANLPGQTFSNVEVGKRFNRMFDDALMKMRMTAKFGQMRRSVRVQARRFA